MTKIIDNINEDIKYELDQSDDVFGWFLDRYMGSDMEGKLVEIDKDLLLETLNNRNCEVDYIENKPLDNGENHEKIKIYWHGSDFVVALANICLHGQNEIRYEKNHFRFLDDCECRIFFEDVRFSPKVRRADDFVYAKNMAEDSQVVFLTRETQNKNYLDRFINEYCLGG